MQDSLDKKLGAQVTNWVKPCAPSAVSWAKKMLGRHVRLEPLVADLHCKDLFAAFSEDVKQEEWTYLPYGPFESAEELATWITDECNKLDPYFFAIVDQNSNFAVGIASYLRITPENGSIEVGHVNFSSSLQSTTGATEAMYLMMRWAFQAGYRRYEWKCNALNLNSRGAAQRLGFSCEGVFRQAAISKGRNRDTVWFAAIDAEWPTLQVAFEKWLHPDNFDFAGHQIESLTNLTKPILAKQDPNLISFK